MTLKLGEKGWKSYYDLPFVWKLFFISFLYGCGFDWSLFDFVESFEVPIGLTMEWICRRFHSYVMFVIVLWNFKLIHYCRSTKMDNIDTVPEIFDLDPQEGIVSHRGMKRTNCRDFHSWKETCTGKNSYLWSLINNYMHDFISNLQDK